MDYKDLRMTIADRSTVRITKPSQNLLPDLKVPMSRLQERTIKVLTRYVQEGMMKSREELVVLGSHLFAGLFNDKARDVFWDELDKVRRKQEAILRLILEFQEPARELAELPWEYIYFPDSDLGKGFFIAADPESRLILSRHVPLLLEDLEALPENLRILVVVSQPEKYPEGEEPLGTVLAGEVIEKIKELSTASEGAIEFEELRQPTRRKVRERVEAFKPHVVHFLCHGKYVGGTGGALAFVAEKDAKTVDWVSDEDLPEYLLPPPRLVFLHACEGAATDSYEAFRGVALQLVYSRVAAVVATQYEVENKVATRFAVTFYKSLGEGKRIDEAVQDGRRELRMYLRDENFSSRAFGSPVVFLQSADNIIQLQDSIPEDGGPTRSQPGAGPDPIMCLKCNGAFVSARGICSNCPARYVVCDKCNQWTLDNSEYCASCGDQRGAAAGRIGAETARDSGETQEAASEFAESAAPTRSGAQLAAVRRPPEPKSKLDGSDGR